MRKDSKDLVLHVCGKRGARHRGGCVGCLMVLSDCAEPMASEDDDCEVGSVRYCREVLGLNNEGCDPRAKEIDRMVSKDEVIRVFGSKTSGKRNLRIENCVDSDGNPDLELIEFAGELHKKVYRTCKSKGISVAFGRGVLADRKGARIDWATFASKTQAKQMKMAASWAERHPGEVVSGRDASGKDASGNVTREVESKGNREEEVSSCDKELVAPAVCDKELIAPAVCDVVSMDVEKVPDVEEQVTWEDHCGSDRVMEDAREDIDKPHVADDDIWDNNRIEEIEEQLKRVDMQRKRWQEEYVKVLQSSLQSLQSDRGLAETEMQDVAAKLKDGRAKISDIQKRILSVKESLEQNKEERTAHEHRLQSLVYDKRKLSRPNSRAPELTELNAERDLVQELLQGTYEQAGSLEQTMARHAQMETILRQRVAELDLHLADVVKNFEEKDARVDKASKKLQEALQVMLHFQSVYNLIKQSENIVIVPRCIPQPREYPHELNPPQSITLKPCPVCARWFYCGDWVGASCGCVYHLHCAAMWFRQSNKCCKVGCAKNMHPDWLTAWGKQWDDEALLTNLEKNLDEWRNRWKDDYKRQGKKRSRPDAFSTFDLTLELGGGFEVTRSGLNTIGEPGLHDLDPKRIRVSEDSSLTCNQCMQDFVIEDLPGEPCHDAFDQEDQGTPVKHGELTLNLLETLEEVGPATEHIPERIGEFEHGGELLGVPGQGRAIHTVLKEVVVTQQCSEKQSQVGNVGTKGMQAYVVCASSTETLEEELENLSPRHVSSEENEDIHSGDKDTVAASIHGRDRELGHADNDEMHDFIVQDDPDLVNPSMQVERRKVPDQVASVENMEQATSAKEMMATPQSVVESDVDDTDVQDFIVDDVRKLVGELDHETSHDKTTALSNQGVLDEVQSGLKTVTAQQIRERETEAVYVVNTDLQDFVEDGPAVLGDSRHEIVKHGDDKNAPPNQIANDDNLYLQHGVKQVVATRKCLESDSKFMDGDDSVMQDITVDAGIKSVSESRHQVLELEVEGNAVVGQVLLESDRELQDGTEEVADIQHNVERDTEVGVAEGTEPSLEPESGVGDVDHSVMQGEELHVGANEVADDQHNVERDSEVGVADDGEPSLEPESTVGNVSDMQDNESQFGTKEVADIQHNVERDSEVGVAAESKVGNVTDTHMQECLVGEVSEVDGELRHQVPGLEVPSSPAAGHVFSEKDKDVESQATEPDHYATRDNEGGVADDGGGPRLETRSGVGNVGDTTMQDCLVEVSEVDGELEHQVQVDEVPSMLASGHVALENNKEAKSQVTGPDQYMERDSGVGDAKDGMPCIESESLVKSVGYTSMHSAVDGGLMHRELGLEDDRDAAAHQARSVRDAELHSVAKQVAGRENKLGDADNEEPSLVCESRVKSFGDTAVQEDTVMQDFVIDDVPDLLGELAPQKLEVDSVQNAGTSQVLANGNTELQSGDNQLTEGQSGVDRETSAQDDSGKSPCLGTEITTEITRRNVADTDMQDLTSDGVLELVEESRPATFEDEDAERRQILSERDAERQSGVTRLAEIKVGCIEEEVLSVPTESRTTDMAGAPMQEFVVDKALDVRAETKATAVDHEDQSGDLLERGAEQNGAKDLEEMQGSIEPGAGDAGIHGLVVEKGLKLAGNHSLEMDEENSAKHNELIQSLMETGDETGPATPPVSESTEEPKDAFTDVAPSEAAFEQNQDLQSDAVETTMTQHCLEIENAIGNGGNAGIQDFLVHDDLSVVGDESHHRVLGEKNAERDGLLAQHIEGSEFVASTFEDDPSPQDASVEVPGLPGGVEDLAKSSGAIGMSTLDGCAAEKHWSHSEVAANIQPLPPELMSVDDVAGTELLVIADERCQVQHACEAGGYSGTEERGDNVGNGNPPDDGEVEVVSGPCSPRDVCEAGAPISTEVTAEARVGNMSTGANARGPRMPMTFFTGPVIDLLSDDDDDDVIEVAAPSQFVPRRSRFPGKDVQQRNPSEETTSSAQPGMYTALLRAVQENPRHR